MASAGRRGVQSIGDIVGELFARRGLARVRGQEYLQEAWENAAGQPTAKYTRVGALRHGMLEVLVSNSILLQELAGFHRQTLLAKLQETLGSREVRDIRFCLENG